MNNPAFIIDGFTEKKIVQELCPGQPVRRTDLNGKSVTIDAIAKKIAPLIRSLGNKYYPIIILIDKEERSLGYDEIANQLYDKLIQEGISDQDIRVSVADRMIENWIIADWEQLNGSLTGKPKNTEGISGSSQIKKVKGSYDKIIDGSELFVNARQELIYKNSPSYRFFINQLHDINCNYLKFEK